MKSVLALWLLAVLCIVNAIPISDDLEYLRREVRELIYIIDNDILRLDNLRIHTEEDTDRKVNDKLHEEQDSYREFKYSFLTDLNNKIKDAKEIGKEVAKLDVCYNDTIKGIVANEEKAEEEASKCIKNAESSIKSNLGFLDYLIETGRTLISELEDVFLDCHDKDIIEKKRCIVTELSRIKADVKRLEDDIISAETTTVPLSKNVIMQAINCIKNAYAPIYSESDAIRLNVKKCIDNVESKNKA